MAAGGRSDPDRPRAPWTTGQGAAELAALSQAGFEPIGLVTGLATEWSGGYSVGTDVVASHSAVSYVGTPRHPQLLAPRGSYGDAYYEVYSCPHVASPFHRPGYNFQDVAHEQARRTVVGRALARMRDRARALGAHGVVGVGLDRSMIGASLAEVSATGTALRRPGAPELDQPFTSGGGAQDLGKLLANGWVPVAVALGNASVRVMEGCTIRSPSLAPRELVQLSEAMGAARRLAVGDLEAQATKLGEGVIGVRVDLKVGRGQEPGTLVEMLVSGTAVRSFTAPSTPTPFSAVLSLAGRGRPRPAG